MWCSDWFVLAGITMKIDRKFGILALVALVAAFVAGIFVGQYSRSYSSSEECVLHLVPKAKTSEAAKAIRYSCNSLYYTHAQMLQRK